MRSFTPRATLVVFVVLIMLAAFAPASQAAVPTMVGEHLVGCGGGRGGGERDAAGNLYITCRVDGVGNKPSIRVYDANGNLTQRIAAPAINGNAYFNDISPSPSGEYLYVSSQSHHFFRLKKQGAAYVLDAGFNFDDFLYGVPKQPMGEFLSVDGNGNIYIANGTWVAEHLKAPMVILKYDKNGKFLTQFGDWGNQRKLGEFYWLITDLVATPDGTSVYTTEVGNNRVQRWQQQFGTHRYVAVESFGNTAADDRADDPNQAGDQSRVTICGVPGKFGAPYASGLDVQGNLYVLQTNCDGNNKVEVQRRENGVWRILTTQRFNGYDGEKPHAMGIDAKGNIYVPSVQTRMLVTGYEGGAQPGQQPQPQPQPEPQPEPVNPEPELPQLPAPGAENQAPVLRGVELPAETDKQVVAVRIDATDDAEVMQVRFAAEDGNWKPWQAFAAEVDFALTPGVGTRGVFVQVRDAQGLVSASIYKTLRVVVAKPQPPVQDPQPNPQPEPQPEVPVQPNPQPVVNTAPVLNAVEIPAESDSSTITVRIDATDNAAVTQVRFATEDGNWKAWRAFARDVQFELTPGLGMRGVFTQVRDAQGLTSRTLYKTLRVVAPVAQPPVANPQPPVVNPQPPVQPEAPIEPAQPAPPIQPAPPVQPEQPAPPAVDAAPVVRALTLPANTDTQLVRVRIDATDDRLVTGMRFANEDGNWNPWLNYTAQHDWLLSPNAMLKGVFVQVRDAAGQTSNIVFKTTLCVPCKAPNNLRAMSKGKNAKAKKAKAKKAAPVGSLVRRVSRGSARLDRVRPSAKSQHFDFSQRDNRRDVINCGGGFDTVLKRPEDITRGCERVLVVRDPR